MSFNSMTTLREEGRVLEVAKEYVGMSSLCAHGRGADGDLRLDGFTGV